jgi:hypothetical protein
MVPESLSDRAIGCRGLVGEDRGEAVCEVLRGCCGADQEISRG